MSARPKPIRREQLAFFADRGGERKTIPLIMAVYYERYDQAAAILRDDPGQIEQRDPFAGLTALHIAIFRGHWPLVRLLAEHPHADLSARDNFDRRAIDMCVYTADSRIFDLVCRMTFPGTMRELDTPDDGGSDGGASVSYLPRRR